MGEATITSPIGEAWSNTNPYSAASRPRSKALAPRSARSSLVVKSSSRPTGDPSRTSRRVAASTVATAALLSAPRMASLALESTPSWRWTSTAASSGTVSMCAQSSTVRASSGPARRASTLPASEPVAGPLSSSSTSSPSSRSSDVTVSAMARSAPDGLSISHNRTKSSHEPLALLVGDRMEVRRAHRPNATAALRGSSPRPAGECVPKHAPYVRGPMRPTYGRERPAGTARRAARSHGRRTAHLTGGRELTPATRPAPRAPPRAPARRRAVAPPPRTRGTAAGGAAGAT